MPAFVQLMAGTASSARCGCSGERTVRADGPRTILGALAGPTDLRPRLTVSVSASRCGGRPGSRLLPGSVGDYHWSGLGGTFFWVDPKEQLFAILMAQAMNQRDHLRQLFKGLVYAAIVD